MVALSTSLGCTSGPQLAAERILLISIDTLRADHLGSYGYERDTSPNIDALAASSWLFESAYVPVPRTGPSVAALLTGMFPMNIDEWAIRQEQETLAEVFASRGWRTMAAVDNANLSEVSGYAQGFDTYRETWEESDHEITKTQMITSSALEQLEDLAQTDEPFFMWLHYVNPHLPYTPPSGFDRQYIDDPHFDGSVTLPRTQGYFGGIRPDVYVEGEYRLAYYVAQYDGEILFTDSEIGKILDLIRSEPNLEDTVIVLTADHGEGLGEQDLYFEHGPYVLDSHVRVPLIVHIPTDASSPRRIERPVSTIDVAPTIFELAGISLPRFAGNRALHPLSGQSLVPTDDDQLQNRRQNIFFASLDYWGVRAPEWKMILKTREDDNPGQTHQLFDLMVDPDELDNLYDERPEQAARLLRRLQARLQIQANLASEADDLADRYKLLDQEALDNLRALGYLR